MGPYVNTTATQMSESHSEFYHGDYNKIGDRPWQLPHTVYKFSAIAQDVILNIANIYPTLKHVTM
jgi:hypothetical protein